LANQELSVSTNRPIRRLAGVKSVFLFFCFSVFLFFCFSVFLLPVNFFPLSQVASVAFLPSGLLLSDFRSCQLGILASADAATGSTLLRGLENESPQQQSFFQGSLRFDKGVTAMGIIFDFGMPVQHAFDAPFRLKPGQV
jgi:hypothetical protein